MLTIANQLILEQIPGCLAWKDQNLKYLGANKNLLMVMNLDYQDELIGLDDHELALNSPIVNQFFREQDLLVLQGQSLEIFHHLENSQDSKTYFLQKSPLRDQANKVVGVIYSCTAWSQANLLASLKQIDQKYHAAEDVPAYYSLDANYNPANLSKRELECVFLQLRGYSAKQTAELLGLSKRTVEYYTDNIKAKLGCINKTELLLTAVSQGYHQHIPKSLLKLNLPELLKI